ncbi:hypothetical protein BGZ72_001700 [Mortierella alpina]|nr:hypothetical protein BGZ72_001700 [Mortierella alpina]
MAHHHASPYHDVKNVQMIASPLFKVPVSISPPYDMHSLPEDISMRRYHDFSLEHRIVQEYRRIMAEEAAAIEAKESAYRLYAEERQARLKQERISRARKIAPGFLDNEDRRILTPTMATAQIKDAGISASDIQDPSVGKTGGSHFDYREFETKDDPVEEPERHAKEEIVNEQPQQPDTQLGRDDSPTELHDGAGGAEGVEEEVIVQAVPLSELTGMLRDSCLEDDSSSSTPRPWTSERDAAAEKSSLPSFNATRLDYREFEQGLGPPDPWDTPVDDLAALKDVISQQMGHNSSSQPADNNGRPQLAQPQPHSQSQHQPQQQPYPYHHQPSAQSYQQQPLEQQPVQNQYQYGTSTPTRSGYNSSPIPIASYVPPPKLTGIAQQQQLLQQHQQQQQQQQNRHSTGAMGAHPVANLTPGQKHSRFGDASPSPPPLPPPPRGATASPTASAQPTTSVSGMTVASGVSRPPLPARPHRPADDTPTSGNIDQVTVVLDRSMTPPRPPLPPPPPPLLSVHGSVSGSSSAAAASTHSPTVGSGSSGAPALRPRPPKDHDMLHDILGPKKTSTTGGGFVDMDVDQQQQQQQQQVAPAPPQANSLIEQLVNMGFTREQSRGALEKYDYDLEKATNHLLDWDD